MSTATIYSGGLTTKDPQSVELFSMNWGSRRLDAGVGILSSTWTISGTDALLTKDQDNTTGQVTQLRLTGGTLGKKYVITNTITTDETPSQTIEESFTVLIANK